MILIEQLICDFLECLFSSFDDHGNEDQHRPNPVSPPNDPIRFVHFEIINSIQLQLSRFVGRLDYEKEFFDGTLRGMR